MKPKHLKIPAFLTLAMASQAFATSDSWKANVSGNWNDVASWTAGNIPGSTSLINSSDVATFGFTLATNGKTVTVDTNRNIGGITFSNTSGFGYTLSSGNLLLTNGGVIQSTGTTGAHADTISSAIEIQGDGGTASFTNSNTLTTRLMSIGAVTGVSTLSNVTNLTLNGANTGTNAMTGVIGDGGAGGKLSITKSDAGTWSLQNNGNSYSGGTFINAGILQALAAGSLGTGTITLAGGQLHLINANNTAYNNNTIVSGNTQISATRVSGSGGSATHTLGTLSIGANTLTLGVFSGITGGLIFGNTTLTGNATFTTNPSTTLTLGATSGAFSITKTNTGTLVLGSSNSYSGATNINGGVVRISASNNLGDGSATNTISFNGGTLQSTANTYSLGTNRSVTMTGAGTVQVDAGQLTIDGSITGAGNLAKTGLGNLVITNSSHTGSTLIQNGVVQTNNTATSNIVLGTSGSAFNYGILGLTANFTGALGTAAGNVSWATGINTSGGFAVMDATTRSVNIGGNVTPSTLTLNTGGFVGGTLGSSNSRIKFGDANGTALGTVDFKNSINLGSGDRSLIFVVDGAAQYSVNVSGNLTGSGLASGTGDAVVKFGNGNMMLSGTNTYTGRTIVGGQGAVILDSAAAFSPNTWMSLDGGAAGTTGGILGLRYDLAADLGVSGGKVNVATSGGFAAFGADHSVTLNSGAALVWGSTTSFVATGQNLILGQAKADGKITLTNNIDLGTVVRTVQTNRGTAAVDAVLSGDLTGTSGGLTKAGTGILSLAGNSSYLGATAVSAGTLLVNGSLGNTAVSVSTAATLGGTGTIAGTVSVTGSLSPGASIESLATGTLSFANTSTLIYEMSAANSDLVDVSGQLNLTGTVTLSLTGADGVWTLGDKVTLISYFDIDGVTAGWNGGLFTGIADDSELLAGSNTWLFNYNDTTGGSNFSGEQATGPTARFVTMTLIPEPSVSLLGAVAAIALLRRRR
ncbi:MAG: autotransporter-associated beta strand repeat-containing protein [Luteolibacter sp.]|uniref:beta strand repeat-containing protein n=1 Tax=Luteolibacter sp. TaxID=1962973 RepID=UPI003265A73C